MVLLYAPNFYLLATNLADVSLYGQNRITLAGNLLVLMTFLMSFWISKYVRNYENADRVLIRHTTIKSREWQMKRRLLLPKFVVSIILDYPFGTYAKFPKN